MGSGWKVFCGSMWDLHLMNPNIATSQFIILTYLAYLHASLVHSRIADFLTFSVGVCFTSLEEWLLGFCGKAAWPRPLVTFLAGMGNPQYDPKATPRGWWESRAELTTHCRHFWRLSCGWFVDKGAQNAHIRSRAPSDADSKHNRHLICQRATGAAAEPLRGFPGSQVHRVSCFWVLECYSPNRSCESRIAVLLQSGLWVSQRLLDFAVSCELIKAVEIFINIVLSGSQRVHFEVYNNINKLIGVATEKTSLWTRVEFMFILNYILNSTRNQLLTLSVAPWIFFFLTFFENTTNSSAFLEKHFFQTTELNLFQNDSFYA